MKRRKGVTVFGAFTLSFAILAVASYAVILLALIPMVKEQAGTEPLINAFDILARNKDIIAAFSNFDKIDVVPHYVVYSSLGIFLLVTIIWLIVDLKRGRKIVFFFVCCFLLACYAELIYSLTLLPIDTFISDNIEAAPMLFVPLGGALLASLATVFAVILFIVDMATGRVVKEEAPAFIKEPTEEVQEGHFEEVKDENEVEEAPSPVEEKPVEETPVVAAEEKPEEEVEELPEEEKEEAPTKKPAAPKKVKKEPAKKAAPAKKAEPKKEEKKPAPKKEEPKKAPAKKAAAPAKKAEPKEDEARKTGTIILENEEGKAYAKAFHVSRRPDLNKWQVKATGSEKALKLFNTQKEAIEYANQLAKNQNVSVRVHSKEGKIRKHQ